MYFALVILVIGTFALAMLLLASHSEFLTKIAQKYSSPIAMGYIGLGAIIGFKGLTYLALFKIESRRDTFVSVGFVFIWLILVLGSVPLVF